MKNFIQIVRLLDGYKLRNIDVLGNDDSKSRFTEFYRLIKDGTFQTDEDAAKHFYGVKAKPSNPKYRFFKSQFKDRLFNTLLFTYNENDQPDDFGKVVYDCIREWTSIEILFRRNISYTAIKYAERLLTICLKYEITDLTVRILERLKGIYATLIGDKKKYQEYKEKFYYYKEILEAEYLAKEAFQELRIEYVKSIAYRPENSILAEEAFKTLKPLLDKYNSPNLLHFVNCVEISIYQTKRDHQGVIDVCDKAIDTLKQKPFGLINAISIYQNQKVIALLMLQRFEECKIALTEALTMQVQGHFNWYKTMESKMLLAFHTQAYTEGYETYLQVKNTKQFKDLEGHNAEIWVIYKAYLYLSTSLNKMPTVDKNDKKAFGSFRLTKYLNDIPVSSGDKKGMNVTVLVSQIALMIVEKMYDLLIDRIETIEKYLMRHVPKSDAAGYRANQFIKVLLEIPKSGFNRIVLERSTRALIADIASVPYNIVEAGYKFEVMPYPVLWGELLQCFGVQTLDIAQFKKIAAVA